jgi:hypothetical protein
VISFRPFHKLLTEQFIAGLNSQSLLDNGCPYSQLDLLTTSIHDSINSLAPLSKKIVTVRSIKKFVSPSTKALMKERDCLLSYCKRYPLDIVAATNLHNMKKRVKRCVQEDTKLQLDGEIKKRGLWGGLNRLFPHKKVPNLSQEMDPNLMNNFFVSISQPSSSDDFPSCLPEKPDYLVTQDIAPFYFKSLCANDIKKA